MGASASAQLAAADAMNATTQTQLLSQPKGALDQLARLLDLFLRQESARRQIAATTNLCGVKPQYKPVESSVTPSALHANTQMMDASETSSCR